MSALRQCADPDKMFCKSLVDCCYVTNMRVAIFFCSVLISERHPRWGDQKQSGNYMCIIYMQTGGSGVTLIPV